MIVKFHYRPSPGVDDCESKSIEQLYRFAIVQHSVKCLRPPPNRTVLRAEV